MITDKPTISTEVIAAADFLVAMSEAPMHEPANPISITIFAESD